MITPTAIDWDADGDVDLIVGDEDGRVAFVENVTFSSQKAPLFRQPVYFKQLADSSSLEHFQHHMLMTGIRMVMKISSAETPRATSQYSPTLMGQVQSGQHQSS